MLLTGLRGMSLERARTGGPEFRSSFPTVVLGTTCGVGGTFGIGLSLVREPSGFGAIFSNLYASSMEDASVFCSDMLFLRMLCRRLNEKMQEDLLEN